MLRISKINIFFFKARNAKKERLGRPKKGKLLLLIPEDIGDRKLTFLHELQNSTYVLIKCSFHTHNKLHELFGFVTNP